MNNIKICLISGCKELNKFLSAFSLTELLISLIAISCILAALAPLFTKKVKTQTTLSQTKHNTEYYANPGSYALNVPNNVNTIYITGAGAGGGGGGATTISKSITITQNTSWTVPKGVSSITFTITGSGGGGGAGNGDPKSEFKTTGIYNSKCLSGEFTAIRGSTNEEDLCITNSNLSYGINSQDYRTDFSGRTLLSPDETCSTTACCWSQTSSSGCNTSTTSIGQSPGCYRDVCNYFAANEICNYHKSSVTGTKGIYRLLYASEAKKIIKYINEWSAEKSSSDGLDLCTFYYNESVPSTLKVAQCAANSGSCNGTQTGYCQPCYMWIYDDSTYNVFVYSNTQSIYLAYDSAYAGSVRCARPISYYTPYSGAGGSSGAKLTKTISVLPGDTLTLTIGSGGVAGVNGTSRSNGCSDSYNTQGTCSTALSSSKGNGGQGGDTILIHKRTGSDAFERTYRVKGGMGGAGASTASNAESITPGTGSSTTTPNGTCYADGIVSCTDRSYAGYGGSSSAGGGGCSPGGCNNITDGSASSGGYLYVDSSRAADVRATSTEIAYAKGQAATTAGWGGGGGYTPIWATGTSHFYQGGKGANGSITLDFDITIPGSGGGSGVRIGGANDDGENYEIKLKVTSGQKLTFKVGQGGAGSAASGENGENGQASIIGDNEVIFYGGSGGNALSTSQISSLNAALTNEILLQGAEKINSILAQYTPTAGICAEIDENGNEVDSTYGIEVTNSNYEIPSGVNYKSDEFNGESSYTMQNSGWGFEGGVGGYPFGIKSANLSNAQSCGGGSYNTDIEFGIWSNKQIKACATNTLNAASAKSYSASYDDYGGSGGAGAGLYKESNKTGAASDGVNGYFKIRY